MDINHKARFLLLSTPIVLYLVSCQFTNTTPTNGYTTLTATETTLLYMETGTHTETYTPSPSTTSATATQTLTPTRISPSYKLKDWREPIEVITKANMDRVEKIGELEFTTGVIKIGWSPEGSWFGVSTYQNGGLFILDAFSLKLKWLVEGSFIAFSPDGLLLENGGQHFSLETGKLIVDHRIGQSNANTILDIEFSPDGKYIASVGTVFAIIYPFNSGIKYGTFGRIYAEQLHASISPDSKSIAVNYVNENFTELWDPYLRKPIRILKLKGINGQGKPRFTKDGKSLFFTGLGTWEEEEVTFLQEWDYRNGRPLYATLLPEIVIDWLTTLDTSPTSPIVAFGTKDGNVYLLPMRDCVSIKISNDKNHKSPIANVAFRPDGMVIATNTREGNMVSFWGIPASEGVSDTPIPTVNIIETPSICPSIPLIVEYPIPKFDWFGGELR